MRILIPFSAAPDSFQDNVAHTLRKMGHQVCTANFGLSRERSRTVRIALDTLDQVFPEKWNEHERWVISKAESAQTDLVLCLTQSLRTEVLQILKAKGNTKCVAWWGDTPANMRKMGLLSDGWDHIYIKDAAAVKKFQAVGLPAQLLHEAMNPDWHRPPSGNFSDFRGTDVVVAGSYYGYRQFIVDRLIEKGVPIALYGPPPPRWSHRSIRSNHRGKYIVKEEKSRIFWNSQACLNSTALSEGNSLNCRAFEICGTGALQLIENKPAVSECFEPMREVLTYDSIEDICDHLARARREPDWALAIREAGFKRAHENHTYNHRLDHILRNL